MPNLRALVKRHSDDPFTLLGINTGDSETTFREDSEEFEVTWPCVFQGRGKSPVSDLYQVEAYPTMFLLDAEGRIRHKDLRGKALDEAVAKLLAEMKAKPGD